MSSFNIGVLFGTFLLTHGNKCTHVSPKCSLRTVLSWAVLGYPVKWKKHLDMRCPKCEECSLHVASCPSTTDSLGNAPDEHVVGETSEPCSGNCNVQCVSKRNISSSECVSALGLLSPEAGKRCEEPGW